MSKRSKYTVEEKYAILKEYENGIETIHEITTKYGISGFTFYNWSYKYNRYGIDGLRESKV